MALLILWIAISNESLFEGGATLPVILLLLGYGYFALTRITNRRTVLVGGVALLRRMGLSPNSSDRST